MEKSILKSTKKVLMIEPDDGAFDDAILMHINSVFADLAQLGIGPPLGFAIEDDSVLWEELLEDDYRRNNIKTYMHLRVRLLFDPPQTSYHVEAIQKQIDELTFRISVQREGTGWVDPTVPVPTLEP